MNTTRQTLVKKLTKLLDSYALRRKNISYVKDEGSNLNIMTITLKSIVNYDIVATPLWPSVGVKPNTWKSWRFGGLESAGTPECLELDNKAQNTSH